MSRHNERHDTWRGKRTRYGRNGQLAGDWVGLYGPVVTATTDGTPWPDVLAVDELPIAGTSAREKRLKAQHVAEQLQAAREEAAPHIAAGGIRGEAARQRVAKAEKEARSTKSAARWGILAAYGYPAPAVQAEDRGQLVDLHAVPALTSANAAAWLRSRPGRPSYVIADGGKMWRSAVAEAWPTVVDPETGEVLAETPRVLPCTWHYGRVLRGWLRASSIIPRADEPIPRRAQLAREQDQRWQQARARAAEQRARRPITVRATPPEERVSGALAEGEEHPLIDLAQYALTSAEGWDALLQEARHWQAHPLAGRLEDEAWVREELATWPEDVARSIGGLEGVLRKVKFALKGRDHLLTNPTRTNRMLKLMVLHAQGRDDVDAYTRRIRDHLMKTAGRAAPQRAGVVGVPGAIPLQRR